MNQPYYVIPAFSPYADNPQFLKKVFRSKLTVAEVFLLAAIMAGLLYQTLCNTFFREDVALITNRIEKELYALANAIVILDGLTQVAFILLPFIGLVLMYHRSKSPEAVFPKAGITLCEIFFVSLTVVSGLDALGGFSDIVEPMLSDLLEGEMEGSGAGTLVGYILFSVIPGTAYALWGLGGFLACSSLKRTLSCQGIYTSGFGLLAWGARILCPVLVAPEIFFCIYYRMDPTSEMFTEFALGKEYAFFASVSLFAEIMYLLHYVLLAAALVVTVKLSKRYRNAANNAMVSIRMKGVNQFTADVSTAGQYYQSFYTAPGAPVNAPPTAVVRPPEVYYPAPPVPQRVASPMSGASFSAPPPGYGSPMPPYPGAVMPPVPPPPPPQSYPSVSAAPVPQSYPPMSKAPAPQAAFQTPSPQAVPPAPVAVTLSKEMTAPSADPEASVAPAPLPEAEPEAPVSFAPLPEAEPEAPVPTAPLSEAPVPFAPLPEAEPEAPVPAAPLAEDEPETPVPSAPDRAAYCPQCGAPITFSAGLFCTECGTPLRHP